MSNSNRIVIIYENNLSTFKIERDFKKTIEMEDIAAMARMLLLLTGYDSDIAESLVFADIDQRRKMNIECGSFYGDESSL